MAADGGKVCWQIKTAKTDIEELTARVSKADGKAEAGPWHWFFKHPHCVRETIRFFNVFHVCVGLPMDIQLCPAAPNSKPSAISQEMCGWNQIGGFWLGLSSTGPWRVLGRRRLQPQASRRLNRASQRMKLTSRQVLGNWWGFSYMLIFFSFFNGFLLTMLNVNDVWCLLDHWVCTVNPQFPVDAPANRHIDSLGSNIAVGSCPAWFVLQVFLVGKMIPNESLLPVSMPCVHHWIGLRECVQGK